MSSKKQFRILCIDGGGVRGIIPAYLLQVLEERSGKSIYELFDLIVGTSSGGLIALSLTLPKLFLKNAKYTAEDLVYFYKHYSKEIFKTDLIRKLVSGGGLWMPKYNRRFLDSILSEFLGDIGMHQALRPIAVPIYSLIEQKPILARSRTISTEMPQFNMVDVAMACTAAPTYFAPKEFFDFSGKRYLGIDGGIFANNPQLIGATEAYSCNQLLLRDDIKILSLGTGHIKINASPAKLKKAGVLGWVSNANLIDMMMSADSDWDSEEVSDIYPHSIRLQVTLPEDLAAMDNGSKDNLNSLIDLSKRFLDSPAVMDDLMSFSSG